jgi:site-specific recombinase XerD
MAFAVFHNGKWCVDFTPPGGVRQRVIVGDGSDRRAAEKEAKQITLQIRELRQQRKVPHMADTDFVIDEWLKAKKSEVSDEGHLRYRVYCGHWKRTFADLGVTRFYMIDRATVEAYRNKRLENVSKKTVAGELTALRQLFTWAEKRGYCQGNEAREVKKPKLSRGLPYPFSPAHQQALLDASRSDARLHLMVCLGLYAGLRTGGVAGLRVENVDLQSDTIRVREKGERDRVVPLHQTLKGALLRCPPSSDERWFGSFTRAEVKYLSTELCSFIRRVTGLSGVRARFHNLRHSFGTNLARAGVSLIVIRDLLGHSSTKTTEIYASVAASDLQSAIQRLSVSPTSAPNTVGSVHRRNAKSSRSRGSIRVRGPAPTA